MTTATKANTVKNAKHATHQNHGRSRHLITTKKPILPYTENTKKLPVANVTRAIFTRQKQVLKIKKVPAALIAIKKMMFTKANRATRATAVIMQKAGITKYDLIMI